MPLAAGSRLGSYEILAPLGAGGMGEVYRARDPKLAREVAIKVLPTAMAGDSTSLARFEREAKAVAALTHPNILAIHDFGAVDGVTFAVMELLQGETLRQRLDHGALPSKRAVEIAREISLGLSAAHEKGIVHRDLKPENLFLTKEGLLKILDFGLARQFRKPEGATQHTLTEGSGPGVALGTAGYMSPEQVRGEDVDHRSDIFSFGAVLYEMLSGRRAFQGETSVERMNAILREEPPPLSDSNRPIPPALDRIVAHCLEKQPGDRFQSARDLAFDLGTLAAATSGPNTPEAARRPRRWGRALSVAAIAATIALAFWAGGRYSPGERNPGEPKFRRLTFRRGNILSARFAPDARTVIYSASWEGAPTALFSVRTDTAESSALGIDRARILSVSASGELAILEKKDRLRTARGSGTLARIPLGGTSPRQLLENVAGADWAPDGEQLAVIRGSGKRVLEYPIGRRIYESELLDNMPRVSPDGTRVAITESGGPSVTLSVVDREGRRRVLATLDRTPWGMAWFPDSRGLYYIGGSSGRSNALRSVDLSGKERVVLPVLGLGMMLHDVSADGRFLLERTSRRQGMACHQGDDAGEREISFLDGSALRDGSSEGRKILFSEVRDGSNSDEVAYLRGCDASPPIRLGDGGATSLSPDGRWVLVIRGNEIWLLPTGPGSARKLPENGKDPTFALFTPDGQAIAIWHANSEGRMLLARLDGSLIRSVDLPGINGYIAFSPDGQFIAYLTNEGGLRTIPLTGGPSRDLPGPPVPNGSILGTWSADGRFLYFARMRQMPGSFERREIATGKTTRLFDFGPADPAGVTEFISAGITPDGRSYAYTYRRTESSDLFVVDGLK